MPGFPVLSIPDLVEATTEKFGKMKLTDVSNTTQHFRAFNRIFRERQVEMRGGTKIRINLLTERTNTSRWTTLYADDPTLAQVSGLTHGFVPWRFGDMRWAYDEREQDVNQGEEAIQDYIRVKRLQALNDWANFFEEWFWGNPPASTDVETPYPLKYWITKNTTATGTMDDTAAGAGSFSGGAPTGHTTVAELNPSTLTQWSNYTYKYTDITDEDQLSRWETALKATNFEPPTGATYPSHQAGGDQFEHFMGLKPLKAFERFAKKQNENLGYDLGYRQPTYYRAPLVWVPQLDDDSDQPIYSLNWGWLKSVVFAGKWMKERRAIQSPKCEYVWITTTQNQFNIVCYNRRAQAVGSIAAANP
jgi:hypothetical protein